MKSLLSFRATFFVSALVLLTGWQISVPAQDSAVPAQVFKKPSVDEFNVRAGWLASEQRDLVSALEELMAANPAELDPQQLRILDGGLESKTTTLTKQYAEATDEAQRKELESQLAAVVGQHFAVRQAVRDQEIAKLEQEVARLRDLLQQREDARQQIVEGRVDQLIRAAKGLGWDGKAMTAPGAAAGPATFIPRDPAARAIIRQTSPPGVPGGPGAAAY